MDMIWIRYGYNTGIWIEALGYELSLSSDRLTIRPHLCLHTVYYTNTRSTASWPLQITLIKRNETKRSGYDLDMIWIQSGALDRGSGV